MRNLLAFLAAAVLVVAALGWYLDWYKIESVPTLGGHEEVNIDIDSKKITADVEKGAERGAEKLHDVLQKKGAAEGSEPPATGQTASGKPTPATGPRIEIHAEEESTVPGAKIPPP
jgi:hypothetical protein